MTFLGFTSTRVGLRGVLPKDTPTENPENQVRLEPRKPGLLVDHPTLLPCRIPQKLRLVLKAFAEDKFKVIQVKKFVPDKLENTALREKEEMLATGIFLLFFYDVFKSLFLQDC